MSVPESCVLPIRPKEFPYQEGVLHCGAFAAQAVLNAYGLPNVSEPWELHTSRISLKTGSSISKDYYPAILRSYGLDARCRSANGLSDEEKLNLLKGLLAAGSPVILSVGNFFSRETGEWNPVKGIIGSHWISLWGYDDKEGVFYVYDSLVSKKLSDDVPIGNKKRPYRTILRIWPGSIFSRLLLGTYSYIEVKRR